MEATLIEQLVFINDACEDPKQGGGEGAARSPLAGGDKTLPQPKLSILLVLHES